jgi:S-adenosyl methyltransferase
VVRRNVTGQPADGFVPTRPNPARLYDYLLGGRDNYRVDRAAGDRGVAAIPGIELGAREQRAVLGRVVRYLVRDAGIRQLLDVGTGLPTKENVHQVAQGFDPAARVVYVDNDPVILAYAKALLAENPGTVVVEGDIRDPAGITAHPVVRGHLDWTKPIGLLLCGILYHVMDSEHPEETVATLIDALPAGSYVFIHHLLATDDPLSVKLQEFMTRTFGQIQFRTRDQVRGFFHGLEFVEPGLVSVADWHPDAPVSPELAAISNLACAGVARKP